MVDVRIDEEFAALIPPLAEDELTRLRESIAAEGVRDPVLCWMGIIIDGHNRHSIAQELGVPCPHQEIKTNFADRDEVKLWITDNQLARRNLTPLQKTELALQHKAILEAQAEKRRLQALNRGADHPAVALTVGNAEGHESAPGALPPVVPTLAQREEPGRTRDQIAKLAGVSHGTVAKVEMVLADAPPEVLEQARKGEMTVNKAFEATVVEKEAPAELKEQVHKGEVSVHKAFKQVRPPKPKGPAMPKPARLPGQEFVSESRAVEDACDQIKKVAHALQHVRETVGFGEASMARLRGAVELLRDAIGENVGHESNRRDGE